MLTQNISLVVRVKGSAAWPGPKGTYTQQQVEETARARAQAIADFLVAKGINNDRLVVQFELPPEDHRETSDVAKQSDDRFVEIALLASGL